MSSGLRLWAFPMMLVSYEIAAYLANDAYLPSLPTLTDVLDVDQDMAQWTLTIWFIGAGSMQLLLGPISDRFGRRPVMLAAPMLFVVSSLLCGMTNNIYWMYLGRLIQGMCVCAVGVSGYAAIHELFDTKRAVQILSIMGSITLIAPSLGPSLGAVIVTYLDYRWIFYLLALLGFISWIGLWASMPETKLQKDKLDIGNILGDYKALLQSRAFMIATITFCLHFTGFMAWIVESPFIILETYELSLIEYGLYQLVIFGQFIIGGFLLRFFVSKFEVESMIYFGLITSFIAATGMFITNMFIVESLSWTVGWMMMMALGSSFAFGPLNRAAVDSVDLPMGRRMAVHSTLVSLTCVAATIIVTSFNDATLNNLSAMVFVPSVLALLLWLLKR